MGDNTMFTEAPASVTVRCDLRGYDLLFTLRSDNGRDLLAKLTPMLDALEALGATPQSNGHTVGGNGQGVKMCPIHNVPMKRHEKNGQAWYSHKDGDTWCRGGQAK